MLRGQPRSSSKSSNKVPHDARAQRDVGFGQDHHVDGDFEPLDLHDRSSR